MANVIPPFVRGYQKDFRIVQGLSAKRIFRMLDDRFQPEVFLVGILFTTEANVFICVEPDDGFWVQPQDFVRILEVAAPLRLEYRESQMYNSHPLMQQRQDEYLFQRSIRDAIALILERHPNRNSNIECFTSIPEAVDSSLVSVILGLQRDVISEHYRLQGSSVPIHEYRDRPVARSLVDAAISEFFADAAIELSRRKPGVSHSHRDPGEVVRAAGRRLTRDIASRADPESLGGAESLFNACTAISSLKYEQGIGRGRMVIAKMDHQALAKRVSFVETLDADNFRSTRKLLQLASHGIALHSNAERLFGLVEVEGSSEPEEDLFEVDFLDHHHWSLSHAGHTLMRIRYGQPYLTKPPTYEEKLPRDLPRIFPDITEQDVDLLVALVRQSEKELHGTLLVITTGAAKEAERLSAQAILIEPQKLTPDLLAHLTSIDGAVMMDSSGRCYAIGVILDGTAIEKGDSSRGARFNSALRYVSSSRMPCLAVVVSEDGGVDLVPNLRPAIKRSLIDVAVRELEELLRADATPSLRRYNALLERISNLGFYLLAEDCALINRLMVSIEEGVDLANPQRVKVTRNSFAVDRDMDPQFYYLPESNQNLRS